MGDTTFYEVLGVSNNATDVEVTREIFQFFIKVVTDSVAAPVYAFTHYSHADLVSSPRCTEFRSVERTRSFSPKNILTKEETWSSLS